MLNHGLPQTASVGESIRKAEPVVGIAVPLQTQPTPPGEVNEVNPGPQEVLAAAQKIASILASSGNPFPHPTPSNSLDGETSSKAILLHLMIR